MSSPWVSPKEDTSFFILKNKKEDFLFYSSLKVPFYVISIYSQIRHVMYLMPYKVCPMDSLLKPNVSHFVSKGVKTWSDPFQPEDKR